MQNTIVHHEGAVSLEAVVTKVKPSGALIKIGLDVHTRVYVAVAQYDHLLPKAARRLRLKQSSRGTEKTLERRVCSEPNLVSNRVGKYQLPVRFAPSL
jgi:hypothetical protein